MQASSSTSVPLSSSATQAPSANKHVSAVTQATQLAMQKGGDQEGELETHPFLQYYGLLSHQQNMLQDSIRTGTYQQAILSNRVRCTSFALHFTLSYLP